MRAASNTSVVKLEYAHFSRETAGVKPGEVRRRKERTVTTQLRTGATARPEGLRERGKTERLRRITEAAKEVFLRDGYEAATTRSIAELAEVGTGTVFSYVRDKRDLLFLILNDELDGISNQSASEMLKDAETADPARRIVKLLTPIYHYFAERPDLGRHAMQEMVIVERDVSALTDQSLRFHSRITRWQFNIETILKQSIQDGSLVMEVDPALIARVIFNTHLIEIRRWLAAESPDVAHGVRNLEQLVRAVLRC